MTPETSTGPIYTERRGIPLGYWAIVLIVGGYALFTSVEAFVNDKFNPLLGWGLLFVVAFLALITVIFFWLGPALRHIRVDSSGVWLRSLHLPADRIGKIWCMGLGSANKVFVTDRIDGLWINPRRTSFNWAAGAENAVYLEEHRPDGRRRPWLVGTDYPIELAEAARAVRQRAGGPAHHPDDDIPADYPHQPGRRRR